MELPESELENTANVGATSPGPEVEVTSTEFESSYLNLNLLWVDLQDKEKEKEDRENVLEEALKEAKRILEEDEHSWKANQLVGKLLLEKGKFEEALKHISRARAIHPGSEELRHLYESCKSLDEVHTTDTEGGTFKALTMSGRYEIKDIHSKRLSLGRKPEDEISSNRPDEEDVLQGHRLFLGLDRCPQNFEQAARHYTKAAEVNNAEGVYCLALLNIIGKGVPEDFVNGKRLLEKAADLTPANDIGVIAAQLYLGLIFHLGDAVDITQAAELYRKAMEGSCDRAANNFGVLLFREVGKSRGRELAGSCWKIAVHRGNSNAALSLTLLYYCQYDNFEAVRMLNKAFPLAHQEGNRQIWKYHLLRQFREKAELSKKIETFEKSHGLQCDHLSFTERKKRFDKSLEELGKEPPTTDTDHDDNFIPDRMNLLIAKKPSPEVWEGLSPEDPGDVASNKKPYDLKELKERSKRGSVTAHKILQELKERSAATDLWKNCGEGPEDITPENRVALIEAFYNCYIDDSFGECREPEDPKFCKFLEDMLTAHGNEKSDLDRKIRVCYGNVSEKYDPFRSDVAQEGIRRYPGEVPLFRRVLEFDIGFEKSLDIVNNGLDRAPHDLSLLFGRAFLQYAIDMTNFTASSGVTNFLLVEQTFQTFIDEAPEDHPLLPEVFYLMAQSRAYQLELEPVDNRNEIPDATWKLVVNCCSKIHDYVRRAEAAEKRLLCTELPYESIFKRIMTGGQVAVFRIVAIFDSYQLESRVKLVKRHRRLVMEARSRHTRKSSLQNDKIEINAVCADLQNLKLEASENRRNFKPISLEEMNLIGKHTYEGRILSLTLVEDPVWIDATFGFVQVIAKDDKREWLRVHVHTDPEMDFERIMEFGSKFSVVNPCLQLFADGSRILQVKAAEANVIEGGRVDDMCHCCGQENASSTRRCGNCGARYCSRMCQVEDWKELGHRLICDLNYNDFTN